MPRTEDYSIREATEDDLFELTLLAREAFKEDIINKKVFTFDAKKLGTLVGSAIDNETFLTLVLEKENEIVGYFFGMVSPCYFARESQTVCLSWFIQPEHRSVKNALTLLKKYEEWSKSVGAVLINMVNVKMDSPRIFEKLGYTMTEITFVKEVV